MSQGVQGCRSFDFPVRPGPPIFFSLARGRSGARKRPPHPRSRCRSWLQPRWSWFPRSEDPVGAASIGRNQRPALPLVAGGRVTGTRAASPFRLSEPRLAAGPVGLTGPGIPPCGHLPFRRRQRAGSLVRFRAARALWKRAPLSHPPPGCPAAFRLAAASSAALPFASRFGPRLCRQKPQAIRSGLWPGEVPSVSVRAVLATQGKCHGK